MAQVKIKMNSAGVRELLKSSEMQAELRSRAQRIAAAAGPGHRVEVDTGPNRARAAVITDTFEARQDEAKRRTLTSAVGAGR